jgi:hypothetical protein
VNTWRDKDTAIQIARGRALYTEGRANAKAQRQQCAWQFEGVSKKAKGFVLSSFQFKGKICHHHSHLPISFYSRNLPWATLAQTPQSYQGRNEEENTE